MLLLWWAVTNLDRGCSCCGSGPITCHIKSKTTCGDWLRAKPSSSTWYWVLLGHPLRIPRLKDGRWSTCWSETLRRTWQRLSKSIGVVIVVFPLPLANWNHQLLFPRFTFISTTPLIFVFPDPYLRGQLFSLLSPCQHFSWCSRGGLYVSWGLCPTFEPH